MRAKLTRTARRDLDEIRNYTLARWGRTQWVRYFAGLSGAFARIAEDPRVGRERDLLCKGLRSLTFEHHIIFFNPIRHADGAVIVVRIVHERRDLAAMSFTEGMAP